VPIPPIPPPKIDVQVPLPPLPPTHGLPDLPPPPSAPNRLYLNDPDSTRQIPVRYNSAFQPIEYAFLPEHRLGGERQANTPKTLFHTSLGTGFSEPWEGIAPFAVKAREVEFCLRLDVEANKSRPGPSLLRLRLRITGRTLLERTIEIRPEVLPKSDPGEMMVLATWHPADSIDLEKDAVAQIDFAVESKATFFVNGYGRSHLELRPERRLPKERLVFFGSIRGADTLVPDKAVAQIPATPAKSHAVSPTIASAPSPSSAKPSAPDPEVLAVKKLGLAKALIGVNDAAVRLRLEDIVREFPATASAREARALLRQLDQ
jgi:hypothetical protein